MNVPFDRYLFIIVIYCGIRHYNIRINKTTNKLMKLKIVSIKYYLFIKMFILSDSCIENSMKMCENFTKQKSYGNNYLKKLFIVITVRKNMIIDVQRLKLYIVQFNLLKIVYVYVLLFFYNKANFITQLLIISELHLYYLFLFSVYSIYQ